MNNVWTAQQHSSWDIPDASDAQSGGLLYQRARMFVRGAGALLLLSGLAKFASGFGGSAALWVAEPLTSLPFKYVFWIAGGLEIVAAQFCFFGKRLGQQVALVAWLATLFATYRLGLWYGGYHKPCHCLGTFTDVLHISPEAADWLMKAMLACLLIASYAALFWLWRRKEESHS